MLSQLYQKAATGKIYTWIIRVVETGDKKVFIEIEHGELGGKMKVSKKEVKDGKKKGTKAETTKLQQAHLDAQSKLNKKKKEGYSESIEEAKSEVVVMPMLAAKFTFDSLGKKRGTNIVLPAIVQPKLDGWRCIVHIEDDGTIVMKTRSNTDYDTGMFKHIVDELKDLEKGLYLDGEIYTDEIPFEELGLLKKKSSKTAADQAAKFKLLKYYVYDCFRLDNLNEPFVQRYERIAKYTQGKTTIVLVPNKEIGSADEIKSEFAKYIELGYEGIMLRNRMAPYEIDKRSKHLQKYKEFDEDEFTIVGFSEAQGNDKGTVVWTCVTNGVEKQKFDVRPKGTRELRKKWFDNGDKYIGKKLTVIYFGLTKYGIPRMPVGKAIREDV